MTRILVGNYLSVNWHQLCQKYYISRVKKRKTNAIKTMARMSGEGVKASRHIKRSVFLINEMVSLILSLFVTELYTLLP